MSIQLPIANKLELALVAYLWTFGGSISPDLLTAEAGYFDNPAYFTPNPLGAGTVFDGLTWYPGHCSVDLKGLPRIVVVCSQAGGMLTNSGYDLCQAEFLQLSKSDDDIKHAIRFNALRAILSEIQLPNIQALVNRPAAGADLRAVQGFGLDSFRFKDQMEGRDEKAAQHGTKLMAECTAHLEVE